MEPPFVRLGFAAFGAAESESGAAVPIPAFAVFDRTEAERASVDGRGFAGPGLRVAAAGPSAAADPASAGSAAAAVRAAFGFVRSGFGEADPDGSASCGAAEAEPAAPGSAAP
ncbi:hypothetical protein AB0J65_25175, partial [Streptomyces toxytricini]